MDTYDEDDEDTLDTEVAEQPPQRTTPRVGATFLPILIIFIGLVALFFTYPTWTTTIGWPIPIVIGLLTAAAAYVSWRGVPWR